MGTRHLTAVIKDEEFKVAQYGQWDGYPEGQGATILEFLKETDLNEFNKALGRCRFLPEDEAQERYSAAGLPESGWMGQADVEVYNQEFPYFSRDYGAGILQMIVESTDDVIDLQNSQEFAEDSLFCEYVYVLDLDNKTLEVYGGYNDAERTEGRFENMGSAKIYSFDELPSVEQLALDINGTGDED
jgi:hypothetical protein